MVIALGTYIRSIEVMNSDTEMLAMMEYPITIGTTNLVTKPDTTTTINPIAPLPV